MDENQHAAERKAKRMIEQLYACEARREFGNDIVTLWITEKREGRDGDYS